MRTGRGEIHFVHYVRILLCMGKVWLSILSRTEKMKKKNQTEKPNKTPSFWHTYRQLQIIHRLSGCMHRFYPK